MLRVARHLGMILPLQQNNQHDDCGCQIDDDDKLC